MGRVLVVDDNRDLGKLTSELLKERGFRVNIAFDGESALARIKQEPYDLMILDYRLPRISGLTVLEKTQQIRPNLKTIMISAFGTEPIIQKAKELGAYAVLDKPFDIDELVRIIKKSLREQVLSQKKLQSKSTKEPKGSGENLSPGFRGNSEAEISAERHRGETPQWGAKPKA